PVSTCPPTQNLDTHLLSLPDALPISSLASLSSRRRRRQYRFAASVYHHQPAAEQDAAQPVRNTRDSLAPSRYATPRRRQIAACEDRKSTRLNSSHVKISYAVFCLKKK